MRSGNRPRPAAWAAQNGRAGAARRGGARSALLRCRCMNGRSAVSCSHAFKNVRGFWRRWPDCCSRARASRRSSSPCSGAARNWSTCSSRSPTATAASCQTSSRKTSRSSTTGNGRDRAVRERRPANHGRRHARHQREHGPEPPPPDGRGRAVPDSDAAVRSGAGRRVQRQGRDRADRVHRRPRRADLLAVPPRLRQRHARVRRRRHGPRCALGGGWPTRRAPVHRRRRHRQRGRVAGRSQPSHHRRGDDLLHRLSRATTSTGPLRDDPSGPQPEAVRGGDRRRLFRADRGGRPRPDLHGASHRSCTVSTS